MHWFFYDGVHLQRTKTFCWKVGGTGALGGRLGETIAE